METDHINHIDPVDRIDFVESVRQGIVCARVDGPHICSRSEGHVDTDDPCSCPCGTDF